MNETNSTGSLNVVSHERLPDAIHYVFGVSFLIFDVAATSGNIAVLFVFFKSDQLRSANCFLVAALCFGDLLMSSVGLTMLIISSFATHWILGEKACTAYGTLMTFLGLSQITLLAAIAYTRYLLVVHNNCIRPLIAQIIALSSYVYALGISLAPILGWSVFVLEPIGTSCGPNWVGIDLEDISYNMTLLIICFLVPFSIILFSYTNVYIKAGIES
ncbi:rhodopsin, G0-coupled-like [Saccostrea cucullata]|uniref:rhodopsin, G0-coupled-like n=1 Tax=Saccostrea cuccullata TaxID=36930 RepID=UPI002ED3D120